MNEPCSIVLGSARGEKLGLLGACLMLHAFMVPLVEMVCCKVFERFQWGGVAKRISWIGVGDAVWISWYEAGSIADCKR